MWGRGAVLSRRFQTPLYRKLHDLRFVPVTYSWATPIDCIIIRDFGKLTSSARAFADHLQLSEEPDADMPPTIAGRHTSRP
jgi:hypothetical protein